MRHGHALGEHFEAHGVRLAIRDAAGGFLGRDDAAGPVVTRILLVLHLFLAHLIKSLGRAEAGIGMSAADQGLDVTVIDFTALSLAVGFIRAADVGAFVILQTQPAQAIIQLLLGAFHRALGVGILQAHEELSTRLFGEQVTVESGASGTEVHVSRGGRGDAGASGLRGQIVSPNQNSSCLWRMATLSTRPMPTIRAIRPEPP